MRQKYADLYGVDARYWLPRLPHLKINVTYRCDRGCSNCNRSVRLCPSSVQQDISPKQISDMLEECVKNGKTWTRITLTGGEPTMHDKFEEIVDILMEYKKNHNPKLNVGSYTYHHPKFYYKIESVVKKYPDFIVIDTKKWKPRVHKLAIHRAPIDIEPEKYNKDHLYTGCNEGSRLCGIGFDYTNKFYLCPLAAAIARVFRLDMGIKKVADLTVKNLVEQCKMVCPLCGCYAYYRADVNKDLISPTWEKAIKEYNEQKIVV